MILLITGSREDLMKPITFNSENPIGKECPGFLCNQDVRKKYAVIVLQEWWGVNPVLYYI